MGGLQVLTHTHHPVNGVCLLLWIHEPKKPALVEEAPLGGPLSKVFLRPENHPAVACFQHLAAGFGLFGITGG